jgi:hypothetical protein
VTSQRASGHFETLLARFLVASIKGGRELDVGLVSESYYRAGAELGVQGAGADSLHIQDIASTLQRHANELSQLSSERAERLIFDLIYMH